MFTRNRDSSVITVLDRFRICRSPRRLVAMATRELLSDDVTATHYKELLPVKEVAIDPETGRKFTRPKTEGGKPVMRAGIDARGREIKLGQEMEYLDWRRRKLNPVWNVYQKGETKKITMLRGPQKGLIVEQEVWLQAEQPLFESEDEALAFALESLGIPAKAALSPEMIFLADDVLDGACQVFSDNPDRLDICSQEPANYTEASSTYTLGFKDHGAEGSFFGNPGDRSPSGREVLSAAITDGAVTGDGTASHYGVSDVGDTILYGANSLDSSEVVSTGNTFAVPQFAWGFPDPS